MKLRFLIPLIIFIFIGALLWRGLQLHPNKIPSPLINKPAPTFSLPSLFSDKKISNQDLIGKVILLNVWASWCYACTIEHEVLMQIKNDVIIYGFNYKDDNSKAKEWLKAYGNPYHDIIVDQQGATAIDWGVYGTPETFVIDKKGIIRYKHIGPITAEIWVETLRPLVEKLQLSS